MKTLTEQHHNQLHSRHHQQLPCKYTGILHRSKHVILEIILCCNYYACVCLFVFGATAPQWARASSFTRFLDHTRRTTVGRTHLDEYSARRRDLYLTSHNTHNRKTSMPPVGFEPTISASERPQTYALDRAATGTGMLTYNTIH